MLHSLTKKRSFPLWEGLFFVCGHQVAPRHCAPPDVRLRYVEQHEQGHPLLGLAIGHPSAGRTGRSCCGEGLPGAAQRPRNLARPSTIAEELPSGRVPRVLPDQSRDGDRRSLGVLICIFLAAAVVLAMIQQYRSENPAPHMVLDAKGTRAVTGTGMPRSISAQHQVPLGPEAEERFSLYALTEPHEDARALFNPELLRRLQESPGLFDIEVVDDWIFVYAPGQIVTSDPNTWSWAASVTDALLGAAQRWQGSTQESRDERGSTARCGPGARAEAPRQQTLRAADRSDAGTAGTVHRGGHTPGIVRGTSRRPAPDAL